jgi:hypothetical protein
MRLESTLRKAFATLVTTSLLCAGFVWLRPAAADEGLKQYSWVVLVETKKLKNQFDYENSHLKDVVKCEVSYFYVGDQPQDAQHPDEAHKISYEDYWFSERRPLGLERHHKFAIDEADGVSIRIRHKKDATSDIEQEAEAAAGTILRLHLDTAKNHNPVAIIKLPNGQPYDDILNELRNKGAFDAQKQDENEPLESSLNMFFREDGGNRSQTLYYN